MTYPTNSLIQPANQYRNLLTQPMQPITNQHKHCNYPSIFDSTNQRTITPTTVKIFFKKYEPIFFLILIQPIYQDNQPTIKPTNQPTNQPINQQTDKSIKSSNLLI